MSKSTCAVCLKEKTSLICDDCADPTCKYCSVFMDETKFEYIDFVPDELRYKTFCQNCYHKHSAQIDLYQDNIRKAQQVTIFTKDQSAESKWMKRIEKPIVITDCLDRDETLLRMAFLAVQKGFDTLVDVDIKYTKVGDNSYKKYLWSGSGIPVDPKAKK